MLAWMVLLVATLAKCRSREMRICWIKHTRHPLSRLGWIWQAPWTRKASIGCRRISSWLCRIGNRLVRIASWLIGERCWLTRVPDCLAWISN